MAGSVPEGWQRVRLGELAESITSGGTPKAGAQQYYLDGTIPFAKTEDVVAVHGRVLRVTESRITQLAIRETSAKIYPPGTVLVTMYGTIGATALTAAPIAANQAIAALIKPSVDSKYLLHLLVRERPRLQRLAGQTTQANISGAVLKAFEVVLPTSLPEQRAIAAVLDAVDETIERTEAVIAATEELRRALLHDLLTRGVPGWHSEWKHVPGLGTVPACWEVVRLGEVATVQTGRAVNTKAKAAGDSEVPYLSVANVKDGYLDLTTVKIMQVGPQDIERYGLRVGDVLFTEGGDADKLGRGTIWRGELEPCLHQNHVFAVRANPDRTSPEFLAAYASGRSAKRYFLGAAKQTTNLASINSTQLRDLPLPLPNLYEQHQISTLLNEVAATQDAVKCYNEHMSYSKRSLADGLLSGALRVSTAEVFV